MAVFGLIPARGGSKGIPDKNIAPCADRPLIAWTCEAASGSALLARTIVSTDSDRIARVAGEWGVAAPFLRPAELAQDTTPSIDVLLHALSWLEARPEEVRALVLLQPTSPLRTSAHIDAAVQLFLDSGADSVVSVMRAPHRFHPSSVLRDVDGWLAPYEGTSHTVRRRQDAPPVFARNGPAILVVSPALLRAGRLYGDRTRGFVMSAEDSVDVDELSDLRYAEFLLRSRAHAAPAAPGARTSSREAH
jgi:CMP-N,N'-diacetyllegionaminic acid synthase